MRSGTGRHRRPRQAPAIFVTAGVTSAGLAMPLLAAGGAQAADSSTWDRVAQCESGGMWSADTGNGFYGGLQFTQDAWDKYGGRDYAPRADLASRAQQIAVAEKMLAAEGPEAWPNCATNAGLTDSGSTPDVDPGAGDAPDALNSPDSSGSGSSDTSGSPSSPVDMGLSDTGGGGFASGSGGSDGGDEPGSAIPSPTGSSPTSSSSSPSSSPSSSSPTASGSGSASSDSGSGTGRHRGSPAPEETHDGATAHSDGGRNGAQRSSRDGHSGRTSESGDTYTVRPGDNLSDIAQEHSLDGRWHALYEANKSVIGDDPNLILPGQRLDMAASEG